MKKEKQILREHIDDFHNMDSEDADVLIWMIFNQVLELVTTERIIPEFNELPEEMQRTFEEDFVFKVSSTTDTSRGGVTSQFGENYPCMLICKKSYHFDINNEKTVKSYRSPSGLIMHIFQEEEIPSIVKRILLAHDEGKWLVPEYDNFHKDPEIGDYIATSIESSVAVLIAHEMAHALQYWIAEPGYDKEGDHNKHNDVWKKYYRTLRKALGLVRR